ncbi:cytochrome c oxidase assembly protein [Actinoplanes sp. KI2]|uniref:cytochrome c oxidase assembly protein n=1 Tax=Actinoplanes sp. KI2 TaxID=2983315 RepID=UPI0021D5E6B3|nr:cytochrome c oxidase assembly protein [Actinoplanes sp. KI2]MCU7726877.1 cytochrome c oxidase assembly protein [Actinoplanes sp. KI2]
MSSVLPDLVGFAVAAIAATLYLWGVRRVRRWPLRDTAAFLLLGVGSLVAVSAIAPARFPAYAVEVMALLLVVPFLMALGHPLQLALGALPPRGAERLRTALANPVARLFSQPIVGPLMLAVLPFGIFFTALLPASLTHPVVLALLRLVLLAAGIIVLVPLWESQTLETRIPYALALLVAFIELLADALPGIIIRLDTHVLAAGQFVTAHPLRDQQLGGDLLWGMGEVIDLPFLVLLLVQWVRSDARDARAADEALDARRASTTGPATAEAVWERPWWETDASVFGDRAPSFGEHPKE